MSSNIIGRFSAILSGKVLSLLLSVIFTPVIVRLLGSELYGEYAFIISVLGITMILVNAGIFDGERKYIAESRSVSGWEEHVFGFYLRLAVILAVLASTGYILISWYGISDYFLEPKSRTYLYFLAGVILARQADSLVRGGLMGLGLERYSESFQVLQRFLFAITGILLVYSSFGVVGLLIGQTISSAIVAILGFLVLIRYLDYELILKKIPSTVPKKELFLFNGYSIILILLTASLYHVDILLIQIMVGSEQTGYYRAALVVAEFLWFIPNALQTTLLHSSSELWSNQKINRISEVASRTTKYNIFISLIFAIGIGILAPDFVPIYFGNEFTPTILPLLLLLPGTLGFALARPIFAVGQGKGNMRPLILATGVAASLNLVLNVFLIPQYNILGAALATSTSYGIMIFLHIIAARHIGFNPIRDIEFVRIIPASLLSFLVLGAAAWLIKSEIISLVVLPPIGFIVYLWAAVRWGFLAKEDIQNITGNLPEPISSRVKMLLQVQDS